MERLCNSIRRGKPHLWNTPVHRLFHDTGGARIIGLMHHGGSWVFTAFPGPDLTDHLTLPFVNLLTRLTFPQLVAGENPLSSRIS
jgi:hypothetical protein